MLAPAHAQAYLQPVEAVQPPHALAINRPAFAAEQDPDTQIAKARTRVGNVPDAEPQRRLVARGAPFVPGRATELRQQARTQLTSKVS